MNAKLKKYGMLGIILTVLIGSLALAHAQYWTSFGDDTRYLALGDSLSAGYGAHPSTNGFVYQLYQSGVIDNVNNTLLCNLGIPNALSQDVLDYQIPQAHLFFSETESAYQQIITLTVGGNDLVQVLGGADPGAVLATFMNNLTNILGYLTYHFPDARIYVANQYDPLIGGGQDLVYAINGIFDGIVPCFDNAKVVDVYSAFEGRKGLLLIEKNGSDEFQVHPTNAGYRVMTQAFIDAIRADE